MKTETKSFWGRFLYSIYLSGLGKINEVWCRRKTPLLTTIDKVVWITNSSLLAQQLEVEVLSLNRYGDESYILKVRVLKSAPLEVWVSFQSARDYRTKKNPIFHWNNYQTYKERDYARAEKVLRDLFNIWSIS